MRGRAGGRSSKVWKEASGGKEKNVRETAHY